VRQLRIEIKPTNPTPREEIAMSDQPNPDHLHSLFITTCTCLLDDDNDWQADAYVVVDSSDNEMLYVSMEYDDCQQWIKDNWRDYATPDALAEYDYGLT